jgi:hypothetical protein
VEKNVTALSSPVDDFAHPLASATATAWIIGVLTIALGAFCAFAAFIAPVLFGPLVAFVIGTERLLSAAQARNRGRGAAWALLAAGWFGSAACMVHTPLLGNASSDSCAAMLAALLTLNATVWTWSRISASVTWRYEVAPAWIGTIAALVLLYSGPSSLVQRVAAAGAIALVLIGCEWITALIERSLRGTAATPHLRRKVYHAEPATWPGALEPRPL